MLLRDISFFRLYLVSCIYLHARWKCCFKNLFSEDDDDELMLNVLRCHLTY